jgi:hypothetical protein
MKTPKKKKTVSKPIGLHKRLKILKGQTNETNPEILAK